MWRLVISTSLMHFHSVRAASEVLAGELKIGSGNYIDFEFIYTYFRTELCQKSA